MIKKFRKRLVFIEAIQWTGDYNTFDEIKAFAETRKTTVTMPPVGGIFYQKKIIYLDQIVFGGSAIHPNDYITKNADGRVDSYNQYDFERFYEPNPQGKLHTINQFFLKYLSKLGFK